MIIELEPRTFNRLASGRLPVKAVLAEANIEGDRAVANWFLGQTDVPY